MAVREPVRHRGDRRSCPAVWGQQRDGVRAASRRAEYVPYSVRCRKRVRGAREGRRVAAQWWRGGAQSPWGAGMSLGVKHRRGGRGEQSRKGGGRLETLRLGVRAERRSFAGRRGTGPRREATGGSRGPGPQCGPVGRRFRFRWGRGGGRGAGPRDRSVRGASGRRWDPQNKGRGGSGAGRPQPGRAEAGGGRAGPSETAAGGGRKAAGGLGPGRAGPRAEERWARRPGRGAMAAAETKIIYHLDEQETPYLVKLPIPAERVTLGDFKGLLNRPNYKFYFKSMDDDFG